MQLDTQPELVPGQRTRPPSRPNRYTFGPIIGRGGMGEVVSARDEQIGRSVAIKRLRPGGADDHTIARFVREAQIQGRLEHPAIVPVHDLWYDDEGRPSFAMKQLAGATLADIIKRLAAGDAAAARAHTLNRRLDAFVDVCLAVEHAHTRGVIHRDLKPANIVVGEFGDVYVLDWGVAHVVGIPEVPGEIATGSADDTNDRGNMLGTPGYMSPEQIRSTPVDARSDVYALGCILFELLALQALHPRGMAGVSSTLEGGDTRPSHRAPGLDIPPELDALCVAATELDPAARPATARALAERVRVFLDGECDLEMRRQLAERALATAREALATGDGVAQRRVAMAEASRALAFEPTNRAPVEIICELITRPPAEVPDEVEKALHRSDLDLMMAYRWQALAGMGSSLVVFAPLLVLAGIASPGLIALFGTIVAAQLAIAVLSNRANVLRLTRFSQALGLTMVVSYAELFSPLFVAPAVGLFVALGMAMLPSRLIRATRIIWLAAGAVFLPWLLGLVGFGGASTEIAGGDIVVHTGASHIDPVLTRLALVSYVAVIIGLGVTRARILVRKRRSAERALQLQAWQLRQLL